MDDRRFDHFTRRFAASPSRRDILRLAAAGAVAAVGALRGARGSAQTAPCGPCEDNNPCTTRRCREGVCVTRNVADGTPCSDDGNPCTDDVCRAGHCVHEPRLGAACSSGNPCHIFSFCGNDGLCRGMPSDDGTPCPGDGNPCTRDICRAGQCTHDPIAAGTDCSDPADPCTVGVCDAGGGCAKRAAEDGTPCDGGTCRNGSCHAHPEPDTNPACPTGTRRCAGRCVRVASDERNCGRCGKRCKRGQRCRRGRCR